MFGIHGTIHDLWGRFGARQIVYQDVGYYGLSVPPSGKCTLGTCEIYARCVVKVNERDYKETRAGVREVTTGLPAGTYQTRYSVVACRRPARASG